MQEYNFYNFWTYESKVMEKWRFWKKSGQGKHVLEPTNMNWPHQLKKVGSRKKEVWEKTLRVSSSVFWTLFIDLEGQNLPFFMQLKDFIYLFAEIRVCYDLYINSLDFCLLKNSSRIASVIEIFCTLLQCKVHLSMFHSFLTSKTWYTST